MSDCIPKIGDHVYYSDSSEEEAIKDGDINILDDITEGFTFPYHVNGITWKYVVKADEEAVEDSKALASQIGGSHYKDMAIQPVEYNHANNLPFIEGNVVKYVSRWRDKGGIADLNKAKHMIDLLIELEGNKTNG